METLEFLWNCIKVALGIGFVIFVHELGHFALAKWNGVKVIKFSIGFGPTLLSYRKGVGLRVGTGSRPSGPDDPPSYGETEYTLAALPLGGFVLMSGEGIEGQAPATEERERPLDPRDLRAKPVGARMAIITAGVIMNAILGWACFTIVFSQGTTEVPARVGGVMPGSPAYKAGLRAGDEIVAVDGRRDLSFTQVTRKIMSSVAGQVVHFTIKRPGADAEQAIDVEARREPGGKTPAVGFYGPSSLNLVPQEVYHPLPGMSDAADLAKISFKMGDKLVAVGPAGGRLEPVVDYQHLLRLLLDLRKEPIEVEVERDPFKEGKTGNPSSFKFVLPPHHFVDFGLRMAPGPVVAIRPGSPARKAGVEPGDVILAVAGNRDYDPMRLPEMARAAAIEGKPLPLTIGRQVAGKPLQAIELSLLPDASPIWVDSLTSFPVGSLDVPGLGLAIQVRTKVAGVTPGSPAAVAGLKQDDVIGSVVLTPVEAGESSKSKTKPITITFDPKLKAPSWPNAFALIQEVPWSRVELTLEKSEKLIAINPAVDPQRFHPLRGLHVLQSTRPFPPLNLREAAIRGAEETWDSITSIFAIFQNLAQRRVGGSAFSGVLKIGQVAYAEASNGWVPFIQFLGFISINLAVLNFLPIPPLDGGQFLFLLAEKIKGKPLPESWLNVGTLIGVVFVLTLMLAVNVRDIIELVLSYVSG